ncbi:D-amino-acid transaminase [Brevundimonas vancanneytii]|uniref:Probable branched-chain-amino-acid aminotransferase n=1 Tax=Brevundimonas vancanneytii TaxID=1325724 RepID=A0A4P1K422_9CAUL|nr:D-amino-acid transaminase [Brevundimonas vancanneytii]VTO15110.1 D-alanine aminotransferase [Brevundimonas vancanneytii]
MSRVAYVNGIYQPHGQAVVHIEDRGFQFADGVYEVWSVFDGKLADYQGHLSRLARSLTELRIDIPMSAEALGIVLRETIRRNRVRNGIVYIQITRGTAPRDHAFPKDVAPSVIITAKSIDLKKGEALAAKGAAGVTHPDMRWGRCDIKTVGLLPNALAKQAARERGAYEAILFDEMGMVTEGSSTNAWIIDENGKLRTRDTQANILRGITRAAILKLVEAEGIELEERAFSVEEAKRAREVFVTAASSFVMPITSLDGTRIGDGKPGPVATRLREIYLEQARRDAV